MKKIVNIVFYNFLEKDEEKRQACIFYANGEIEQVPYDDAIDLCEDLARENNITTSEVFKKMINNNGIYTLTGAQFEKDFNKFLVKKDENISPSSASNNFVLPQIHNYFSKLEDAQNNDSDNSGYLNNSNNEDEQIIKNDGNNELEDDDLSDSYEDDEDLEDDFSAPLGDENDDNIEENFFSPFEDEDELEDNDFSNIYEDEVDDELEDDFDPTIEDSLLCPKAIAKKKKSKRNSKQPKTEDIIEDSFDAEIEDEDLLENPKEEKKGIIGFLKRGLGKLKKSKLVRKIIIFVTAIASGFGAYTCAARLTKSGKMTSSNFSSSDSTNENNLDGINNNNEKSRLPINFAINDLYDNYSFDFLLAVTQDETQYYKMSAVKETLLNYNGSFAEKHIEQGKDIRAALSFDEVVALQNAYNDFDKNEIASYFNGAEINANSMESNYKSATLQLMGAHVIETSENPVDISSIIDSEKGKNYYNHYHKLFLEIKNANPEEKLVKVQEFGDMVRKDFPITNEVRTEGIMHSIDLNNIESYKLSVVPMIAAYEMMYQNLDVDYTLNNEEIDFLNDVGLCNYAKDKFEKIETITLSLTEDKTNPTFNQFENAMTNYLEIAELAVIDDMHRELSELDSFKDAINWHFNVESNEYTTPESTISQEETRTTSSTSYDEVITEEAKEIPASEKAKVDEQIAIENDNARIEAEREAEATRKEMQDSADEEAKNVINEIEEENKATEEEISIEIGAQNDFVQDVTTDESNDMTGEPLPDPNNPDREVMPDTNETTSINNSQPIYEYEEVVSPEELAEQYVEALANYDSNNSNEDSYQYQLNKQN